MTTLRYTFSKNERLCSKKCIQEMFDHGQAFVKYPFRITFIPVEDQEAANAQILISVSKKKFKRANKRNLIKRKIREAYRLNKHEFLDTLTKNNLKIAVSFVYLPQEILDYNNIQKGVLKALKQLSIKVSNNETN